MAEGVFVNREADGVKRLHAYKRFQLSDKGAPYLFMRVGIPQRKALAYARQAQTFMLVFLLIAVVGIMAMAWFLGNATIVRRLQKLVDVSHSLGHGDLKTRTGVEYRKDELGELTMTFDEMAENLEIEHAGREEAKEHIKKVAEEWQTTFDSITDLIMILDNEYNIVRVNRATVSFFNMPADKILGQFCFVLMRGMDKPLDACPLEAMKKTRKHAETELYEQEGGMRLAVSADPIFNDKGNITGIFHIVKDITDRRYGEEALRESENKFRDLAEKSNVGIYLVQDSIFKYVNVRFAEMHRYTVEKLIDKKGSLDCCHPDDLPRVNEYVQKRMAGEETTPISSFFRDATKNNRMIDVETYSARTMYRGKPAMIRTMLDITDRKRMEEALNDERQ